MLMSKNEMVFRNIRKQKCKSHMASSVTKMENISLGKDECSK